MRYTVFGGVSARVDGRAVEFGPTRLGALLGVLLVDAGRVVSAEELIERVLGDAPPPRARAMTQTWLTRLRQTVPGLLERDGAGYVVRVDPVEIDLHLFRHLVRAGRTAEALPLARHELLSTLDTPWARRARAEFAGELLAARLDHIDARLGQADATLVPELHTLAAQRPLDERIAAQLIEALHGSGRTTEALQHFRNTSARLADELGAEPSRQLTALHRRLQTASAPRQLPAPPKPFTGRALELAELDQAPNGVVVITGTGGVGKTSLAVHWAHLAAERFPDGQLYVNLHGFGPSGAAVSPGDALLRFLSALDVPRARVPHDLAGQSALLRDTLADKRVLMVLDNATDADQVEPLLPRTPNTHVVITSRTALSPERRALSLPLGLLPPDDARELLASRIGHHRAQAEPDAVDTVVRRCARLPLALAVAGARAATQPEFPLAALADELADLDAFADDDDVTADLRSVFSHSCKALSPAALRLFRLLGLMPGSDISLAGAASLVGLTVTETSSLLEELARANLLDKSVPGRFTCHDLLRDYAAELARDDERDEALHRLLDHLALTAAEAGFVFTPTRRRPDAPAPAPGVVIPEISTHEEAFTWLMSEHPTLMAAMRHGTATQTWLMGWSLADVLDRQARYRDLLTSQQLAVAALERLDDRGGLGRTLINLGRGFARLGRLDEATTALQRALHEHEGDPVGQAEVLVNIAMLCPDDRIPEAIEHTRRALALFEESGDHYGQANALTGLAWCHGKIGEYRTAIEYAERVMPLWRSMDHLLGEAETWDSLGVAHLGLGEHAQAAEAFTRAATNFRLGGDLQLEAAAYDKLGDTHAAAGDAEQARIAWRESVELHAEAGLPTERIRAKLQTERQ